MSLEIKARTPTEQSAIRHQKTVAREAVAGLVTLHVDDSQEIRAWVDSLNTGNDSVHAGGAIAEFCTDAQQLAHSRGVVVAHNKPQGLLCLMLLLDRKPQDVLSAPDVEHQKLLRLEERLWQCSHGSVFTWWATPEAGRPEVVSKILASLTPVGTKQAGTIVFNGKV